MNRSKVVRIPSGREITPIHYEFPEDSRPRRWGDKTIAVHRQLATATAPTYGSQSVARLDASVGPNSTLGTEAVMKQYGAEFFGTFELVLGGCGSAVLAAKFPEVGIGPLGVALAFGLTVPTVAYAIGHISGCHPNFVSVEEVRSVTEEWIEDYNSELPHDSLG